MSANNLFEVICLEIWCHFKIIIFVCMPVATINKNNIISNKISTQVILYLGAIRLRRTNTDYRQGIVQVDHQRIHQIQVSQLIITIHLNLLPALTWVVSIWVIRWDRHHWVKKWWKFWVLIFQYMRHKLL